MTLADPVARLAELSAQYSDRWVIYQEQRPDGTRSQWVATPRQCAAGTHEPITAGGIETLAGKLAVAGG